MAILAQGQLVAGQSATEPALKAAYLLSFARFSEGPPNMDGAPFSICLSDSLVAKELKASGASRLIKGRRLVVSVIKRMETGQGCSMIYVGKMSSADTARLAVALRPEGSITVGDGPGFASAGGMIELFKEEDRLRFAINPAAAAAAGVKLDAQLLSLAKIVKQ